MDYLKMWISKTILLLSCFPYSSPISFLHLHLLFQTIFLLFLFAPFCFVFLFVSFLFLSSFFSLTFCLNQEMRGKYHPFIHLAIILGCVVLASAVRWIRSAQELIDLFKDVWDSPVRVDIDLMNDLDFSGIDFQKPLGYQYSGEVIPYSGVFQGNGHALKNLVMNGTTQHVDMGLFFHVVNATFKNLVIDSSCSFNGGTVGGLSVYGEGSLAFINVRNEANIIGKYEVSPLVAWVHGGTITLDNCVNNGDITGDVGAAGLIQGVNSYNKTIVKFSNCVNNGVITARGSAGGIVGQLFLREPMTVTMSNCTNNGFISVANEHAGGLVGHCWDDDIFGQDVKMMISDSFNNGDVIAQNYSGGIVGGMKWLTHSTIIINCENKGSVTVKKHFACGLICPFSFYSWETNTTIVNSVNKGTIKAEEYAFGIANRVATARNVVSMGDVISPSHSYTFWKDSNDVDLYYGLHGKCLNCGNAAVFYFNVEKNVYIVAENGKEVQNLLNDEATKQHYGAKWTKELDLVPGESHVSGSFVHSLSPIVLAFAFILIHVLDF